MKQNIGSVFELVIESFSNDEEKYENTMKLVGKHQADVLGCIFAFVHFQIYEKSSIKVNFLHKISLFVLIDTSF